MLTSTIPLSADSVAVVIPSYKVTRHILGVIAGIGPEVARIYVVDDKCPDGFTITAPPSRTAPR
jgi:hypothetical protein